MQAVKVPKFATNKLVASTCRESYYSFFLEFWSLVAAEKLILNWHVKYLCDEMQKIAERVFLDEPKEHDLVINCPPGSSKSSIASVLFQPWVWTRMPSARFITGSHSERLSLDLARKSRDVVKSDKYRTLFPEITLRADQDTKGYFANNYGGFRYSTGTGGSVIGMHAHFLTIDDPIDPQGALSDLIINEANVWIDETLSQRKVDKQIAVTILIMQRLHQNDPTGSKLEKGTKIRHICLPADDSWPVKPEDLRARYEEQDGLLDPVRLPHSVLEEAYQNLREVGYAGQYGEQPTPRGGAMFKTDRLTTKPRSELPRKWKRKPVRYWDKAATKAAGAYSVGVKMGIDDLDRVWVLNVRRVQLDSKSRERLIEDVGRDDGREVIVWMEQEPGGSGKESVETSCSRLAKKGLRARPDRVTDDKVVRADTFSVEVNAGNVILVEGEWNNAYVNELKHFPNSRYKDQVDASSGAYGVLTKPKYQIGVL